tara:strand:- start:641 stop:961 length:321 start_codon:yes stop_codon:yes gene_type:complete
MTRTYINGVSKLSYNNGLVSFSLNDTKPNENGAPLENSVIELITDPETLRGICTFIIQQLSNADSKSPSSETQSDLNKLSGTNRPEIKDSELTVGKKIASSDTPHN